MKQEHDFSKGECGKFFRENARLELPVYLDEDVQRHLQKQARSKGMEVARLVNEMLRRGIERIEAVEQSLTHEVLCRVMKNCSRPPDWFRPRWLGKHPHRVTATFPE